jgi:hypothetical protein
MAWECGMGWPAAMVNQKSNFFSNQGLDLKNAGSPKTPNY